MAISSWRRVLRAGAPRPTRANALAAVLALLLGLGIIAQVQLTKSRGLEDLSQSDLVRVLSDVSNRAVGLDAQLRDLTTQRDRLRSGTGDEALSQAQARLERTEVLAGTVKVTGTGITMTISDPGGVVKAPVALDVIQELRDAGAESIQIGPVRVVASTSFTDAGGLKADGQAVGGPIVIRAIGDSRTLATAMKIPGGAVENLQHEGATATVVESPTVLIDALHAPQTPRYARPVPDSVPSSP